MTSELRLVETQGSYEEQYHKERWNGDIWPFIASDYWYFCTAFKHILGLMSKDQYAIKLFDVGCGTGNILLLAHGVSSGFLQTRHTLITAGVEINNDLRFLANNLRLGAIRGGDALKLPKSTWKEQDIIHYYQPIRDKKLMTKLERKIEDEAKVGAYIMANLKTDFFIEKDTRFEKIVVPNTNYRVWKKVEDRKIRRPKAKVNEGLHIEWN